MARRARGLAAARRGAPLPHVAGRVGAKARWRLSMGERERVAVGDGLAACAGG